MYKYLIFSYFDYYPNGGMNDFLAGANDTNEVLNELQTAISEESLEVNVQIYNTTNNNTEEFTYSPIYYGYEDGSREYEGLFLNAVKDKIINKC